MKVLTWTWSRSQSRPDLRWNGSIIISGAVSESESHGLSFRIVASGMDIGRLKDLEIGFITHLRLLTFLVRLAYTARIASESTYQRIVLLK